METNSGFSIFGLLGIISFLLLCLPVFLFFGLLTIFRPDILRSIWENMYDE